MLHLINKIMSARVASERSKISMRAFHRDFSDFLPSPSPYPGSMCFMCLLFLCSCCLELITAREWRQINCLRAFMAGERRQMRAAERGRRSYFDKINWCAIMEGVVVMNLWQKYFMPRLCVHTHKFSSLEARSRITERFVARLTLKWLDPGESVGNEAGDDDNICSNFISRLMLIT